jgi:hypothetical protein
MRQGGAGYAEKGGGRNKRNKVQTPAFLLKCEVESASAKDDVKAGLEAFQRAVTVRSSTYMPSNPRHPKRMVQAHHGGPVTYGSGPLPNQLRRSGGELRLLDTTGAGTPQTRQSGGRYAWHVACVD